VKYQDGDGITVSLTDRTKVGSGGEGDVHVIGPHAYKIMHDANRCIPLTKIKELSVVSNPSCIVPSVGLYLNGRIVGYRMPAVSRMKPLASIMTPAFCSRNHIGTDLIMRIIMRMRDVLHHVHSHGCTVVDLNDMNVLVSESSWDDIAIIDADSWQTPSFPPTAIMESIRDPDHRDEQPRWDEGQDWYACAILACQALIGIHPFKGKHPHVSGMQERMWERLSIFDASVSIPHTCRPFTVIPPSWKHWMETIFHTSLRPAPPNGSSVSPVHVSAVLANHTYVRVAQSTYPLLSIVDTPYGIGMIGAHAATCNGTTFPYAGIIGWIDDNGTPVAIQRAGNTWRWIRHGTIIGSIEADDGWIIGNLLVMIHGHAMTSVSIRDICGKYHLTKRIMTDLSNAAIIGQRCVFEQVIGSGFLVIPDEEGVIRIPCPIRHGERVVDILYSPHDHGGVIYISTSHKGQHITRIGIMTNGSMTWTDLVGDSVVGHRHMICVTDGSSWTIVNAKNPSQRRTLHDMPGTPVSTTAGLLVIHGSEVIRVSSSS
jgi:hypothetical protein